MGKYYVGLDVHSRESVFVVKNDEGALVARGSVPTTVDGLKHLRDSGGLPAGTGVALETGTSAFPGTNRAIWIDPVEGTRLISGNSVCGKRECIGTSLRKSGKPESQCCAGTASEWDGPARSARFLSARQ